MISSAISHHFAGRSIAVSHAPDFFQSIFFYFLHYQMDQHSLPIHMHKGFSTKQNKKNRIIFQMQLNGNKGKVLIPNND